MRTEGKEGGAVGGEREKEGGWGGRWGGGGIENDVLYGFVVVLVVWCFCARGEYSNY